MGDYKEKYPLDVDDRTDDRTDGLIEVAPSQGMKDMLRMVDAKANGCRACVYWLGQQEAPGEEIVNGVCRFAPPNPRNANPDGEALWALTHHDHWCGEWMPDLDEEEMADLREFLRLCSQAAHASVRMTATQKLARMVDQLLRSEQPSLKDMEELLRRQQPAQEEDPHDGTERPVAD